MYVVKGDEQLLNLHLPKNNYKIKVILKSYAPIKLMENY